MPKRGKQMVSERPENGAKISKASATSATPAWEDSFLAELVNTRCMAKAARHAGIHRDTPYQSKRRRPEFAKAIEEAKARGLEYKRDDCETSLFDRALNVSDPESGRLLRFALQSHWPATYANRQQIRHEGGEAFGQNAAVIQARILEVSRQRQAAGRGLPDGN